MTKASNQTSSKATLSTSVDQAIEHATEVVTETVQQVTDSTEAAAHETVAGLQKLAQRVQEEATPYIDKARGLIDQAEVACQDVLHKIEDRAASNDTTKEALALVKEAQTELEQIVQALRNDFAQLRESLVGLQANSELKTYIQQLISKISSKVSNKAEDSTTEKAAA